ncbi:hypothetical protein [Endozoicomonas sp. ALC066]|uniref:hypothetical protein n=1 Tax=Endozoicomonas sp. ALC066 TaxID=3403078 RepID=UPI003BB7038D
MSKLLENPSPLSNREWLLSVIEEYNLSTQDVIRNTGYSRSSVLSWTMSNRSSARARDVPDRAIDSLKLRIKTGTLERRRPRRR